MKLFYGNRYYIDLKINSLWWLGLFTKDKLSNHCVFRLQHLLKVNFSRAEATEGCVQDPCWQGSWQNKWTTGVDSAGWNILTLVENLVVNLGASCCKFWAVEPGVWFSKVIYVIMIVSPAKKKKRVLCIYINQQFITLWSPCIFRPGSPQTLMDSPESSKEPTKFSKNICLATSTCYSTCCESSIFGAWSFHSPSFGPCLAWFLFFCK